VTIVDFVRLMRRHWALLLVTGLIGVLTAGAYVLTRPVIYVAASTGMVVAGDSQSTGGALSGSQVAEQRATAYLTLLGTRSVADRTATELEAVRNPEAAQGSATGQLIPNTSFIRITATGTTAKNAQDLANATLNAVATEALTVETYSQAQGRQLTRNEMEKLTSVYLLPYEPALVPSSPQRTNLLLNLLMGLGAGLVLGAVIAFVRHQFDVRVRSQPDVEETTGGAVLGIVPETKDLKRQRTAGAIGTMGHAGESLRQLRTNLRFVNVDEPPKAVVITSPSPGEGKSMIATNLAQVIAKSGRDVVLLDCDLRKPMQAQAFGVDAQIGLTQVLAGDVFVRDALVDTDVRRLRLLPAGRIPPNPSELLGSRRMQEVIDELARDAFVVIDAPPMLVVTDAGLLAVASDGVILIGVVGKTTKGELALCAKQLDQLGASLLGTVLNKAPRKAQGDVLYGYGAGGYRYRRSYAGYQGAAKGARDTAAVVETEVPLEEGSRKPRRGVHRATSEATAVGRTPTG